MSIIIVINFVPRISNNKVFFPSFLTIYFSFISSLIVDQNKETMESTKETEPDAKVPETSEKKLLKDLKVADLKSELESRGQVTSGVKAVLLERLKGILVEEGHDPLVFDFNAPKIDETKAEEVTADDDSSKTDAIEQAQPEETVDENSDQVDKPKESENSSFVTKEDSMETESKIDDSQTDKPVEENTESKDDTMEEKVETVEETEQKVDDSQTENSVDEKTESKVYSKDDTKEEKVETVEETEPKVDDLQIEKSVEENTEEVDKSEEPKEDAMETTEATGNGPKDNGSSGPVVRCILPPMDFKMGNDDDDLEDDTLTVTGVVFQFNANSILFEFTAKEGDEEESIGEIKPSNLILSTTGKSIRRDIKEEELADHIQVGDKLSCKVVKSMAIGSFSYVEEEEEIGEDGLEKRSSRTVEIKPQWIAISGETVAVNKKSDTPKGLRKEDVNVLEDQLEDLFDYEPDEPDDEEEDIVLIEEVKIDDDDTASVKDKPVKKQAVEKKKEEPKKVVVKLLDKEKPKEKEASVEPMTIDNPVDPVDVTYQYKAKILQLRRPASGEQGKALKVSSCSMELLEGKHAGQTVNAISMSMYMWGYNLSKANLNYVLKYGDVCEVEYKIQPKNDNDFDFDLLLVKKVWIGPKIEKPVRPSHNTDFSVFLSNRSYDETGFLKWVYGQSPEKPFFPFVSDVYEGEVSDFVRDPATNEVVGVFLTNLLMKHRVGKEGNLVPVSEEKVVEKPIEAPVKEAEPAPPGIEDNEDVKAADLNFAEKERVPPENEADWSALHHLQYCVMNESKFFITDDNKVKFEDKKVEFEFDQITNFQAETGDISASTKGLWSSSGPFYTIGTLAYFVKCLGLKFSSYVRRIETLQHKQFVKKRDHSAVIQYLSASGDKAPFNVRKLSDVPKENDNSFFKDNAAIKDDTYCLPMIKNVPIDLAIAYSSDFYIAGVSLGKCDVRIMLVIGDKVLCQLHEMSSAEKRKMKKQANNKKIEYMATIAYTGGDKRPKSATLTPVLSPDLPKFLAPRGWSIEEFAALRTFGFRPPAGMEAASISDLVQQSENQQVSKAVHLTKEVLKISNVNDPAVDELLTTDMEVKIALFVSKTLTKALIQKIQANLKAKIQDQYASPQFATDLQSQLTKIAAAESALTKEVVAKAFAEKEPEKPTTNTSASKKSTSTRVPVKAPSPDRRGKSVPLGLSMLEQLKEVEKESKKKEEESKSQASKSKKGPVRDARKILESYKDSKKMDINEGLPKIIDEWTPLEYLRHFAMHRKKISKDQKYIYFGRVNFLLGTRTNFKCKHGDTEWATLEQLYVSYLHKGMNKNKYLDKLRELGDKGKGLYMHHRDRDELYKYLQGGAAPPNVERRTRRELNPEQYIESLPSKKAKMDDKYSLDKMRREEDRDLKARMQLHLLENQKRNAELQHHHVQQPQVPQMPSYASNIPPIMTASSAMQDSRRSRFDMTMHPNQGPQGPPGVFVPQQVQPMTLDQGDPWARNLRGRNQPQYPERSRSPVASTYDNRMRSRSPTRAYDRGDYGPQHSRSRYDDYGRPSGTAYDPHQPTQSPPRMQRSYSPQPPRRPSPPRRQATPPRFPSPPRPNPTTMRGVRSPPRQQPMMQRSLAPDNDIAQRWNQEMRDISTRAPSQPLGYYERQAQLEAEAENQRLKKALSNKPPEIIDLSDSDNEDQQPHSARGRMPPSPPRLGTLRHPNMSNEPPRSTYNQPPQMMSNRPSYPQIPDLPPAPGGGNNYRNANPPPMNRYDQPPNNFRRSHSPPRGSTNVWADSRY